LSLAAADEAPIVRQYHDSDREQVFQFIREAFPPEDSARVLAQWAWRCEGSPFTSPLGPAVYLMWLGEQLIGMAAGFRVKMWMGGAVSDGEGLGIWVVHPSMRGRKLWQRAQTGRAAQQVVRSPVVLGWTRLPKRRDLRLGARAEHLRPLVRVLDAGPLLERFAHSRALGKIGAGATAAARLVSHPFRRRSNNRDGKVVRLEAFDDRVDVLWERARRADTAMVIRDHRYLNWRYIDRPDAKYLVYGFERGAELEGFLVARSTTYEGMSWGYLVDFLAPENSPAALSALVDTAVDELRRLGASAVVCYLTDDAARSVLYRRGFFPAPQRSPIRFVLFLPEGSAHFKRFTEPSSWYLTMGDGDLELSP
jgi:hypothetical protein